MARRLQVSTEEFSWETQIVTPGWPVELATRDKRLHPALFSICVKLERLDLRHILSNPHQISILDSKISFDFAAILCIAESLWPACPSLLRGTEGAASHKWGYKPNNVLLSPLAELFCIHILKLAAVRVIATVSWVHLPVTISPKISAAPQSA